MWRRWSGGVCTDGCRLPTSFLPPYTLSRNVQVTSVAALYLSTFANSFHSITFHIRIRILLVIARACRRVPAHHSGTTSVCALLRNRFHSNRVSMVYCPSPLSRIDSLSLSLPLCARAIVAHQRRPAPPHSTPLVVATLYALLHYLIPPTLPTYLTYLLPSFLLLTHTLS